MPKPMSRLLRNAMAIVALGVMSTAVIAGQQIGTRPAAAPDPVLLDECIVPAGFRAPVTHVFRLRGGATLVFVAVHHSHENDDASHAAIRAAFDAEKPSFVLVEGAAASKTSPEALTFLTDAAARGFASGSVGENLYAVKLASDRQIRFSGWDFSPDENDRNSVGNGFVIADIVGTHLARGKIDPFAAEPDRRAIGRELAYAARVQPVDRFDYADWYRRQYGSVFDPATGTPCGPGIGGRIARYETYRRNLNLIRLIAEHDRPGEVVLVEAGANHWLALRDYLASLAIASR